MKPKRTRRALLAGTAGVGVAALAGCADDEPADDGVEDDTGGDEPTEDDAVDDDSVDDGDDDTTEEASYEIWALDQGTDSVYVYEPTGDDEFDEVDTIDVGEDIDEFGLVPHMIDFSSDYRYAAIACTVGERTLIYDTETRELVEEFETGPSTHFAGFTPDDEHVMVDVMSDGRIALIDADVDEGTFEWDGDDDIVIADEAPYADREDEFAGDDPVCHQHANGYSYHTLGPDVNGSGLVIVDTESFEVAEAFTQDELRTNCGTMAHPDEETFYLTAGAPSNHEETGGVAEWYVLDTDENLPIDPESGEAVEEFTYDEVARDSEGYLDEEDDAHGFWFTSDGEELWVLNRETDNGYVIDPETNEVVDSVDEYGPAPDIVWGSPDDEYMFVTLRGPDPLSGDPHAAEGETPGFSVLSVEDREIVNIVEPDEGNENSDFHGIGVREL